MNRAMRGLVGLVVGMTVIMAGCAQDQEEISTLTQQNADLTIKVRELQDENLQLKGALENAQIALAQADAQHTKMKQSLDEAKAKLEKLAADMAGAQENALKAKAQQEEAALKAAVLTKAVEEAKASADEAAKKAQAMEAELTELRKFQQAQLEAEKPGAPPAEKAPE